MPPAPPEGLLGVPALAVDGALGTDGDLARLALLGLRDPDLEHAAVEACGHRLGVDPLRQRQRAREGAERALHAVEALLALLVLGLALAGDGQRAVLELDLDVLLRHAGEVGAQDEVVTGLGEVHGRHPAAQHGTGVAAAGGGVEDGVEEAGPLSLPRGPPRGRLPTAEGSRGFSPLWTRPR